MSKGDELSPRMKRFAQVYSGNGVDACRRAGYKGKPATLAVHACWLLRNPKVRAIIDAREEGLLARLRLRRDEKLAFLSETAMDPKQSMANRLKAVDMLNKVDGEYKTKLEVSGELTLLDLVNESMGGAAPAPAAPAKPVETPAEDDEGGAT